MAGIMRVIKGVNASGARIKIDMHAGDLAAAKIPSLAMVISMRTLKDNGAGQVAGKDRKYGAAITKLASGGTFTPIPSSTAFNNRPVLRINDEAGCDIATVAPMSKSFITILVASFSAETLAETPFNRIINLYDTAGTRKGGINVSNGNLLFSPSITTLTQYAMSNFTADVPFIMGFQWNEDTHTARVYKNSLVSTVVGAVNNAVTNNIQPGDFWSLWRTNQALRSVGGDYAELYHFNAALRDGDAIDQLQLQECWDALKGVYGIL